jgi:hypothetical protein
VFRVLTCKTTAELDSLVPAMLPNIDCISGVVSVLLPGSEYHGLPVIKFPAEGAELVKRVIR